MQTKKQNIQQPKKTRDKDDEIDFDKPTRTDKVGFYLLTICGLLVLLGGIDMIFAESTSSGWYPAGRFSGGRQGSINGSTAIVFGLVILSIAFFKQIKKHYKTK